MGSPVRAHRFVIVSALPFLARSRSNGTAIGYDHNRRPIPILGPVSTGLLWPQPKSWLVLRFDNCEPHDRGLSRLILNRSHCPTVAHLQNQTLGSQIRTRHHNLVGRRFWIPTVFMFEPAHLLACVMSARQRLNYDAAECPAVWLSPRKLLLKMFFADQEAGLEAWRGEPGGCWGFAE